MSAGDPWEDEGFAGEDDWDAGEESLETGLEEGFADAVLGEDDEPLDPADAVHDTDEEA